MTSWLKAKFGRMRISTLVLIVAFIALFWAYHNFEPRPAATQEPVPAVVPPGYVPDPNYTWVPRTNVREQPRMTTTTTTPTTTTTTTPTSPTETTSPTSPTETPTTTVIDPDGIGPLTPQTQTPTPTTTLVDPDGPGPLAPQAQTATPTTAPSVVPGPTPTTTAAPGQR